MRQIKLDSSIADILGISSIVEYTISERIAKAIEIHTDQYQELCKELHDMFDEDGMPRNSHDTNQALTISHKADIQKAKIEALEAVLPLLKEYGLSDKYAEEE